MTEELKPLPCPFCNANEAGWERALTGKPMFEELAHDTRERRLFGKAWRVRCGGCGLINLFETREEAVGWWNTRSPAWRDDMKKLYKAADEVAAAYWDIDQDGPDSPCVKLLFDRMKALTDVLWELRRENPPHPLGLPLPPEETK